MKKSHAATGLLLSLALLAGTRELPKYLMSNQALHSKIGGFFGSEYGGAAGRALENTNEKGDPSDGSTVTNSSHHSQNSSGQQTTQQQGSHTNYSQSQTNYNSGFQNPSTGWTPGYVTGSVAGGTIGASVGSVAGSAAAPIAAYACGVIGSLFGPAGTIFGYWAGGTASVWVGGL